jgi:hypothetical protein
MNENDIDRLVADLRAVTLRVDQLLKAKTSLTALERDCLKNAIGNLNTFFAVWESPGIPPRDFYT